MEERSNNHLSEYRRVTSRRHARRPVVTATGGLATRCSFHGTHRIGVTAAAAGVQHAAVQQRRAELQDLRGRVDTEVRSAFLDLTSAASQVTVAESNRGLAAETLQQAFLRQEISLVAPAGNSQHSLTSVTGFGSIANLTGGRQPDTFALWNGGTLTGAIDGGPAGNPTPA